MEVLIKFSYIINNINNNKGNKKWKTNLRSGNLKPPVDIRRSKKPEA